MKLANRYDLITYINDFIQNGTFLSKRIWTNLVTFKIQTIEQEAWLARMDNDVNFYLFKSIHPVIEPHRAWCLAKSFPSSREDAKYVIDMCCVIVNTDYELLCEKCGLLYYNIVEHLLVSCDLTRDKREDFWRDIISINPIEFSVYMDNLTASEFVCTVLSCNTKFELCVDELLVFSKSCIYNIPRICKYFDSIR